MVNAPIFIEVELASDVKKLIKINQDVQIEESLKNEIINYDDDDLLKVTKEFGSLKIKAVEPITDALLSKEI